MADRTASRAHVILDAVRHASNGDVQALRQLTTSRPDALKPDINLRILLTYLPTGTEPELYTDLLRDIATARPNSPLPPPHNSALPSDHDFSEDEARIRVRRLRLIPLIDRSAQYDQSADPLTLFLLHQAHRIDAETGSLELVSRLLEPFVDHSEILQTWMISTLLPPLRLDYDYYPLSGPTHTLADFEKLDGRGTVQSLLARATQRNDPGNTQNIGRDLKGLVGPWMYGESTSKRRKLKHKSRSSSITGGGAPSGQGFTQAGSGTSEWSYVNDWLLELSLRDFQRTVDATVQWEGPSDVDYGEWGNARRSIDEQELQAATQRFAQAALASVYATNESSLETIIGSHRILLQVARLAGHEEPPDLKRTDTPVASGIAAQFLDNLSPAHLLHTALLLPQNAFTSPTKPAISLFNLILSSCYKLLNLGNNKTTKSVAELVIFGKESDQVAELRRTLYKLKAEKMDDAVWASIRRQILWLRNWETPSHQSEEPRGIFSRISTVDLENELLRSMLDGGCLRLAVDIYCALERPPMPVETVEITVLNAALASYDASSNGNRNRGGVRKASEIISTFGTHFPASTRFAQTKALISATHSMSFYSMTLQHGVPFQPVNVRAHKDPMSLIGKILRQNEQSYTHLDDLLDIGQNLVTAGLTNDRQSPSESSLSEIDPEQQVVLARRRITRMAIEAALEENDFDTAYSYVVNRLSPPDQVRPIAVDEPQPLFAKQDDISWRAAYQAGRFTTSSPSRPSLRRLEQRLELLSQALLLAPPPALTEVLTAWQKCEQEMTAQIALEAAEEEKWDQKGDRKVPGGFTADASPVIQKARDPTRSALVEEAPMGLFDVARGAAAALSKSTFPLRSARQAGMDSPSKAPNGRPLSTASIESSDEGSMSGAGGSGRVRKRDMVSSMVTGGLASGIGWVIGESRKYSG